jgi:hypothetical protein
MAEWADQFTYAHEQGHGLGLPHSSGPYSGTYDSQWDVMSGGRNYRDPTFEWLAPHTISYHKNILGWIPGADRYVPVDGTSQTIELDRLADATAGSGYLMVEVPLPDGTFYTVESRRFLGYDTYLPDEVVIIHHVDPSRQKPANLVDIDNDGDLYDEGPLWRPGETFEDASIGLAVRIDAETTRGHRVTVTLGDPGTDPDPQIALTPTSLAYETPEGTDPASKSFTVKNDGGGTLSYTVASNRTWLGLSRTSGSLAAGATQSVTVSVDASGLAVGTQSGTITVGGNGTNAPQTVAVTVTVSEVVPDPQIALTPATLAYETPEGTDPGSKSFTVKNDGGGTLSYTVASNRTWLGLSRTSGSLAAGATQSVTVSVDASGLAVGTQSGTITVGGNGTNAPQTVTVTVTVTSPPSGPVIAATPANLTFQVKGNKAPGPQTLEIRNAGAQDLSWTASESQPWLSLGPTSGTLAGGAAVNVTVEVSIAGLAPGTYDGTITLTGNADNAPQTVPVQLKLSKGGVVKLKKGRLTFAGSTEEQPLEKYVELLNDGDEAAEWTATADQTWVSLASDAGSLAAGAAAAIRIDVDVSGLEPGTHTAKIEFAGGDDELPDTLTVELAVSDGPGVRQPPEGVAADLLGAPSDLTAAERDYLDHVGNGNGRLDVGDVRAWMIQTGRLPTDTIFQQPIAGSAPVPVLPEESSPGEASASEGRN